MNTFIMCVKMLALALCGDFDPVCYDKFVDCSLDEANTIYCASEIGQKTDVECGWYLDAEFKNKR